MINHDDFDIEHHDYHNYFDFLIMNIRNAPLVVNPHISFGDFLDYTLNGEHHE